MGFALIPRTPRGKPFSVNVRAMGALVAAMQTVAVADDASDPPGGQPPWPPPGSGITRARAEQIQAHLEGEEEIARALSRAERAAWKRYGAARAKWLATRAERRSQVPAFKFGSMDGWVVLPAECRQIAKGLEELLSSEDDWAMYLDVLDLGPDDDDAGLRALVRDFARFNARHAAKKGYVVT